MHCSECDLKTNIIETREGEELPNGLVVNSVRRRHECPVCGKRFTTYEILADLVKEFVPIDKRLLARHIVSSLDNAIEELTKLRARF